MFKRDFPSKEEQELVRKYVMERPLYRPSITFRKAAVIIIGTTLVVGGASVASYIMLRRFGILLDRFLYFTVFFFVASVALVRWFAILAVNLYQHYASEDTRRRCLLKPTCSEYAKIVLRKYGFFIGSVKIWIRLNHKCRGNVYYIDEP